MCCNLTLLSFSHAISAGFFGLISCLFSKGICKIVCKSGRYLIHCKEHKTDLGKKIDTTIDRKKTIKFITTKQKVKQRTPRKNNKNKCGKNVNGWKTGFVKSKQAKIMVTSRIKKRKNKKKNKKKLKDKMWYPF